MAHRPIHQTTPALPETGYVLVVDGLTKAEFSTEEGARQGAMDLKRRFPMLQIRVYEIARGRKEEVALAD